MPDRRGGSHTPRAAVYKLARDVDVHDCNEERPILRVLSAGRNGRTTEDPESQTKIEGGAYDTAYSALAAGKYHELADVGATRGEVESLSCRNARVQQCIGDEKSRILAQRLLNIEQVMARWRVPCMSFAPSPQCFESMFPLLLATPFQVYINGVDSC